MSLPKWTRTWISATSIWSPRSTTFKARLIWLRKRMARLQTSRASWQRSRPKETPSSQKTTSFVSWWRKNSWSWKSSRLSSRPTRKNGKTRPKKHPSKRSSSNKLLHQVSTQVKRKSFSRLLSSSKVKTKLFKRGLAVVLLSLNSKSSECWWGLSTGLSILFRCLMNATRLSSSSSLARQGLREGKTRSSLCPKLAKKGKGWSD